MRKSFKDSLKALEADIQHANTLASDYPAGYDGACLQMRLSYSPCAHIFLFLVQWADCHLAGALGLLRILIYKAYEDGRTTMSVQERKASIKQFYGELILRIRSQGLELENMIYLFELLRSLCAIPPHLVREDFVDNSKYEFLPSLVEAGVIFPSLLQLQRGITDIEDRKQREVCASKYRRRDEMDKGKLSEIEIEREEECGICMEISTKVVLPGCNHSLCMKCYRNWRARSQSCPFCRDSLKRVNSGDLWIYTSSCDVIDLPAITKENLKRLLMYIDKLPLLVPDPVLVSYDPNFQ